MTEDLVKRLRWLGDHASFEPHMHHTAADRIEKLEAALREIDQVGSAVENVALWKAQSIARKALEGKDD